MTGSVCVLGLGHVGLPLAIQMAKAGMNVVGYDPDEHVTASLSAGAPHITDVSDAELASALDSGFVATSDVNLLGGRATYVICVPTPLGDSGEPDLSFVKSAAELVAAHSPHDALVVLESTSYPGTTEGIVGAVFAGMGRAVGRDYFLAFSPERIDPGNTGYSLANTPKIVAGADEKSGDRAEAFYSRIVASTVRARSIRAAEAAKLVENTYRQVNIALANELAVAFHEHGIDVWEVISLASTKPFGFAAFYPGPGVGGHCIPVDPVYLSHYFKQERGTGLRLVDVATELNDAMPLHVARRILAALPQMDGTPSVLLLGVTYKPDVADTRHAPAAEIAKELEANGVQVHYNDPMIPKWEAYANKSSVADYLGASAIADLTVLLQPHRSYDLPLLTRTAKSLFDTRGVADGAQYRL